MSLEATSLGFGMIQHLQSLEMDEDSDQNLDLSPTWILQPGHLNEATAYCDKYQNLMCWAIYTLYITCRNIENAVLLFKKT